MTRGDLATAVLPGPFGSKPRPVLIIQADRFRHLESVTVLPLTSTVDDLPITRVTIEPSKSNGLRSRSQIMVDKAHTMWRHRIGSVFGRITEADMSAVDRVLAGFLGLS